MQHARQDGEGLGLAEVNAICAGVLALCVVLVQKLANSNEDSVRIKDGLGTAIRSLAGQG